jgi:hypothetical protein
MQRAFGIIIAICAVTSIGRVAHASTTYSIDPASISAQSGDVGDAFDVIFTNNGPNTVSVAAFSFEVSVADPDITLTGASFSTTASPYIFAGDSFDQDNSETLNFTNLVGYSPQILDGSDVTNDATGISVGPGDSADLGEVQFDVASPAQTGSFAVTFTGEVSNVANANNLATPEGDGISVDSFSGGTITVGSVPEPSSLLLGSLGMAALIAGPLGRKHHRRRATNCSGSLLLVHPAVI